MWHKYICEQKSGDVETKSRVLSTAKGNVSQSSEGGIDNSQTAFKLQTQKSHLQNCSDEYTCSV